MNGRRQPTPEESLVPDPQPTGSSTATVVQDYLADVRRGDFAAAGARFSPDVTYIAPGQNLLAGVRTGPTAAGEWFAEMGEASKGTYGIVETVDWLTSGDRALLIADERGTVDEIDHAWTRAILFDVANATITRVQLFEDDQYGYDAWLGGSPRFAAAPYDDPIPNGSPEMSGELDDPRVRAVLNYQRQVAAGDQEHAREIFWPDVTYSVPGTSLLAGTLNGPDAVMGYFAKLYELTDGTYAISRMHWLTSPTRVALFTRNHASRNGATLSWDEVIVFTFVDGRKKKIEHFSGDQYRVDELFS